MGFDAEKALRIFGSGLLVVAGPQLLEGMFSEWVKGVRVRDIESWIVERKSLWDNIEPKWQRQLQHYAPRMKNLDFISVEWAYRVAQPVNPSLVSLFLNWPEAHQWLESNLEDLKNQCLAKKI